MWLQKVCSLINLFAYYAIGLPSAVTFAFVLNIGGMVSSMFYAILKYICGSSRSWSEILSCVQGLWLGIICAMAVQIFALIVLILRTSWDEEVHP